MTVMDAFAKEAAAVEVTIAELDPQDWGRPGLGDWTVAELVAHLVRAADRIATYLDLPVEGDVAAVDRVGYFAFDLAAAAPAIADRSRQDATRIGTDGLPGAFAAGWRASLEQARALPPDHLVQTVRGPMALEEYAATRVLELVVHHLDLRRAVDRDPAPTAEALAITTGILTGLLGGAAPDELDPVGFVLAATGRQPHADPRLPVLR